MLMVSLDKELNSCHTGMRLEKLKVPNRAKEMTNLPISLLHVPNIIFSSMRNMWRPGNPFAHPRPVKSRNTDAWLYGLYSYDCVPFPPLNPI